MPKSSSFTKSGEPTQRQLRVGEEIRHALSSILIRGEFPMPGLGATSITVTEVRITPDLRHANAYVTPLGGGKVEAAVEILNRHAGEFRRHVTSNVTLKFSPTIRFKPDRSFEEAQKITDILSSPHVRQDLGEK